MGSRVDRPGRGAARAGRPRTATARSTARSRSSCACPARCSASWSARRSASPARSCRASPATRSPTPGSWASTPARPPSSSSPSPCSACAASASTSGSPSPGRSWRLVLVYAIASLGREGATPVKLALAGAAVTAGLASVTTGIVMTNVDALNELRFWQVGSLAGRYAPILTGVAPFLLLGLVASLGFGRALNGLALGEDVARGLGQRVTPHPGGRVRRGRGAGRRGHRRLRADRLRRARRAARRAVHLRARTTAGSCRTRCCWRPSCCCWPTCSAGWSAAPDELQVGVVLGVLGAPAFVGHRPLRPAVGGVSAMTTTTTTSPLRPRRAARAARHPAPPDARSVVVTGALAAAVAALFVLTMMVGSFRLSAGRGHRLGAAPARRPQRRLRRARPAAADGDVRPGGRPRARRLRDDLPAAAAQPARLAGLRRHHLRRRARRRQRDRAAPGRAGSSISGLALGGAIARRRC